VGHEVEAGFERVRDRIRGKNQLTTRHARPTVNLTDPLQELRLAVGSARLAGFGAAAGGLGPGAWGRD
jgi:hypothetical protein